MQKLLLIVAMVALPTRLVATGSAAQLSPTIDSLKHSVFACYSGFRSPVRSLARLIVALAVLLVGVAAQAQIQRSIVNPSFEQPFTGPRAAGLNQFFTLNTWIVVDAGEIPGWETTHPIQALGCPEGGFAYTAKYNCTPIEMWANSFLGVTPANGIVLAELNAYTQSKLFQNICMNTGETFAFNFAHRGRAGADRMQFQIGGGNTVVMDVTTNTTLTGVINPGGGQPLTALLALLTAGRGTRATLYTQAFQPCYRSGFRRSPLLAEI